MQFTDLQKRVWRLELTCGGVRLLERELGMRVLDFEAVFWPAINDDEKTVDMIWELIRPQAEARGVSMMQWLEAMQQEQVEEAREALFAAYVAFFRRGSRRDLLDQIRARTKEIRRSLLNSILSRVEPILTLARGTASSAAAGSSESPPLPSPT